jgi:hypothetical protein
MNIIYYHIIEKLKLFEHVDTETRKTITGCGGSVNSYGTIPYTELNYKQSSFPIIASVLDQQNPKFDGILGINFLNTYKVVIDFTKSQLVLNGHVRIPFNISF